MLAKGARPAEHSRELDQPGMIETEGVHAAGFIGSDFQKMVEATVSARTVRVRRRRHHTGFTGFVQLPERRTRLTRLVSRLTQLIFRETFILSSRGGTHAIAPSRQGIVEGHPYAPLDIAVTASENSGAGWKERGEDGRRKRRLRFPTLTWLPARSLNGAAQSTESTPHD